MPGMENLRTRLSVVRLCVSISHLSGLGARMSDCFLCCSIKTWLRLVLFSIVLVKSLRRIWSGWSGIHFTLSPCVRSSAFLRESRGFTPAVVCMVAMGVLFIAPSMVLKPIFCTWSSLFVWVLAAVAHALAPYPSVDRTDPVYTVFRMRIFWSNTHYSIIYHNTLLVILQTHHYWVINSCGLSCKVEVVWDWHWLK